MPASPPRPPACLCACVAAGEPGPTCGTATAYSCQRWARPKVAEEGSQASKQPATLCRSQPQKHPRDLAPAAGEVSHQLISGRPKQAQAAPLKIKTSETMQEVSVSPCENERTSYTLDGVCTGQLAMGHTTNYHILCIAQCTLQATGQVIEPTGAAMHTAPCRFEPGDG